MPAHRYVYALPRCKTSEYSRTFIALSVYLWNDLADSAFNGVGLAGLRAGPMDFYLSKLLAPFFVEFYFPLSSFFLWVGIVGLGSWDR